VADLERATLLGQVSSYYQECLQEHGETARGVDWNSAESQELRYEQLLRIVPDWDAEVSLLDFGCGYGALEDILAARGIRCRYLGYDISEEMIARARARSRGTGSSFSTELGKLGKVDYSVASGVFNVRLRTPLDVWKSYVAESLDELNRVSRRGFAFNLLTGFADPEKMTENLFYADPCEYFGRCTRRYSRQVALLHDYGLYEFTILVRKDVK
jgi:SAM-dependent methyltransferase